MDEIFADSGFWVAFLSPRDFLHDRAVEVSKRLANRSRIITSDFIEIEVLNSLSKEVPAIKQAAVRNFERLRSDLSYLVIPSTRDLILQAEQLYLRARDKEWSFVDCSSFIIMRERRIYDALAHDRHFEQAGFNALLRFPG